ncbi:MAG: alanine--tRNA ligase [Candidatus Omnitrophota bacterium]
MQADTLRKKFLDFFKSKKHKIVDSDSLAPKDDPTVLFTPAGMNQFKKQFLGHLTGFSRAATSQRCLRTDDLDKVGKTPSHHTFFEMLGNFSFGDYFKEEAIAWAWEFLTKELKINEGKLWVSVYKDDDESYKIWKDKIKVPANKIVKLGDKENFWPSEAKEKGPNGPCGPCSEIFYDQGGGCGKPDCGPACSCGRFPEIWNLVFTQFNRKADGKLEPLPKKNIDTGMGLERLAAVMQGMSNNFETDLFRPIIKEILSSAKNKSANDVVYPVADHIRAIVFAVYDGVLPSNEGRGYVVRKLIRKSVLALRQLGIEKPFLYKLVPVLAEVMKAPYPELSGQKENIAQIILVEENNFIQTLNSSDDIIREKNKPVLDMAKNDGVDAGYIIASIPTTGTAAITAVKLYDTYGIPLDLTRDWWEENIKIKFIENVYTDSLVKELEKHKALSKSRSAMKGDVFDFKDLHITATKTNFSGYAKYETKAKVLKIIKDSAPVKKITKGEEAQVILDKTVFYPESGGQVGDTGELIKGKNIFQVTDTQKFDKVIVHKGVVREGSFKNADELKACVDIERRLSIGRNHTATHLLQAALREVLGAHVQQQGSLVAEDKLRFDFTHFKALTSEQVGRVEQIVNEHIMNNESLSMKEMSLSLAKKTGALAFFGEKYEGKVRVVSIGKVSKEFCGGTHLDSTGQIGLFKIIQEGSVASGVRRIEAATGRAAYKIAKEEKDIVAEAASLLGVPKDKILQELDKRLVKVKDLEKRLSSQILDIARSNIDELIEKAQIINGTKVIAAMLEGLNMDLLRKNVDLIKEKTNNAVIALGSNIEGRVFLVIGITPDLIIKGLDASVLIRDIAKLIGGSGGGRKDFAQAGGNKPENYQEAIEKLKDTLGKTL